MGRESSPHATEGTNAKGHDSPAERVSVPPPGVEKLAALLLASIAFGAILLATDEHLWEHAPDHAYALVGFVAVDGILLLLLGLRPRTGAWLVPRWGALQVLVMVGDILTAPATGHTYAEFAAVLYGNWAFDALLATRVLQATAPLWGPRISPRFQSLRLRSPFPKSGLPRTVPIVPLSAIRTPASAQADRIQARDGDQPERPGLSRRTFLKYAGIALAIVAPGVAILSRLPGGLLGSVAGQGSPGRYRLSITEALVEMVDGKLVYMWAFKDLDTTRNPSGLPRVPGPVLEATAGGSIKVEVTNDLPQNHAFAIPGVFTSGPIPSGVTRQFDIPISEAGTYMYIDPLNEPANRVLGLHGAVVVLPTKGNTPYSYPTANVQRLFNDLGNAKQFPGEPWKRERTRIWLFHQVDPAVHKMARDGADPKDIAAFLKTSGLFKPRYFTINGDSGAFAAHNHSVVPSGRIGQPHLVRILNAGLVTHSPHIHGNHVYVLSVNNAVQRNVVLIDTWTVKPMDRVDWLLPFVRPPNIPGDPAKPLRDLIPTELKLVLGGVPQSPLKYPMHCHTEMSQTAAGGNYPQGLVTGFDITGDLDQDFPVPPGGRGESHSHHSGSHS